MKNSIGDQFWKRYQHRQRDNDEDRERVARRTDDQLHEDYFRLEQRTERLLIICRALWELMEKKTDLGEHDLEAKIAEIDLIDGDLDHRLKKPVLDCPNCGRKLNARNRHCIYCGFTDFPHDAFDLV